jgi:two-component system, NarL family, response regulator NreC
MKIPPPPQTIAYCLSPFTDKQRVHISELAPDYHTVDISQYGEDMHKTISVLAPDYLIVQATETQLSRYNFDLLQQVRSTPKLHTKCIVSLNIVSLYVKQFTTLDISGYLPFDFTKADLCDCFDELNSGYRYVAPLFSSCNKLKTRHDSDDALTDREKEIMNYLGRGYSNKSIASCLFISVKTVETHKFKLIQKLKVSSADQLRQLSVKLYQIPNGPNGIPL